MSKTASLVVRAVVDGKRKNLSPKQAKQLGVKGTYYLRTWEGGKEMWQSLGSDPSVAKVAVIRKEREFNGAAPVTGSQTLREAIDMFLDRRALKQDANAIKRWRWELGRLEKLTAKLYLKDIDRTDVEAYWRSFKDDGAAPRTIYNRVQSLLTFLKDVGRSGVLPKEAMPEFDEKVVDYYNETNPTELDSFFAACTPEERVAFMFFLYTGCREREVMFACWNEISFQKPYTYTVQPKKDLGFRVRFNGYTFRRQWKHYT